MKKKEKEHLKADPFVHFFEKTLAFFKNNRRLIITLAGIVLLLVIIILAIFFLAGLSAASENKTYASAFNIRTDATMSIDQKIGKLQELKLKKGISSAGSLFIAALYYEKGDLANAEKALRQFPGSRIAIINDQKKTLEAQVLADSGKSQEAIDLLKGMLEDKKTEMSKELIILMLAKIQTKSQRQEEAIASLKRILSEFPNTPSANEAQTLLSASEAGMADAR
ncbi:MAG: tetratricopeptide repeat protein [Candidatus Aminicenantes bacterium]|nr:tetratricopeptide repeat protein [Candidatus Aminicenantes bacterium]